MIVNKDKAAVYGARRKKFELSADQIKTLELHFPYYVGLSEENKKIFRKRLAFFMAHKRFVGMHNLDLFDSMKALICAELIKITFGLKYFFLPHFKVIVIYPAEYYSNVSRGYHKGEVNLKGSITLAWTSFKEGIADRKDSLNVAIHEFSHAVYFENFIKNRNYLFINPVLINKMKELGAIEMERIRHNPNHFIRSYGATNFQEFFAVSTEAFFEQPNVFRQQLPELYKLMTLIYNQDPSRNEYG